MSFSHSPAYNLKAVRKGTGIAADTLRAWERRYGLPQPGRSPGGHRLYSEYDIETIKWLMAKQSEGLTISRAVDLWKELTKSGRDPLAEINSPSAALTSKIDLESARESWVQACLAFDETVAEQILNQAFNAHSVEIACMEVLRRGLFEIGELWYQDKASVQQEHFASGIALRRLDALLSAAPPPTRTKTILVACPPGEQHVIPLLFFALFLRRRGWNVINFGTNVPLSRMGDAVEKVQPVLVVLAAQQLTTALTLREMAQFLKEKGIQVSFGGRIFNQATELRERIPAHFLGVTIETSLQAIETLALHPEPAPQAKYLLEKEQALANSFIKHREALELQVREILHEQSATIEYLETANHFLGDALSAALRLGNPAYLNTDMDWLRNLLTPRNISISVLPNYLEVYEQALEQTMGKAGKAIGQWLQLYRQMLTETANEP